MALYGLTLAEELEEGENYFAADFKEYMLRELNWSRPQISGEHPFFSEGHGWLFWGRQDDDPDRSPSYDNLLGFIHDASTSLKVRVNIRSALGKLILHTPLALVQFWAPRKTLDGRILLTTRNQPFALGFTMPILRHWLCEYRMMSKEYKCYADAASGEEQLGLPGRVFLHKLPVSAPHVKHYSLKECPQRDDALRCNISGSWALPVFEHSSLACVGVLEIVYFFSQHAYWHNNSFLRQMYDIFQEFGLRCFDGYENCENKWPTLMRWEKDKGKKGRTPAFRELKTVLRSVCKIHVLPLAMTWVPCSACNGLKRGQLLSKDVEFCARRCYYSADFLRISKRGHLRKGLLSGMALSSPNVLYCSDITQLSIEEYPLVTYARQCNFGGWFTICLHSSYTGNDTYVLEFFLPVRSKDNENIRTTLSLILGTMLENFKTFKLASGQELGEVLSVEVVDFQNGQKIHSIQMIQATRIIKDGGLILLRGQLDQPSTNAINNATSVVSKEQSYIWANEPLQNREATTQLDSSDRPSMDPLNNGENAVTAERNIIVVTSSEDGKRKTQEREHKKNGVRIEVSLEDILKRAKMKRKDAAEELKVSISTFKRACRGYGIHRWPPRKVKMVSHFRPSPHENEGQISQLNSGLSSNQALAGVAQIKPGLQDASMVTIRAKYRNDTIKFRLPLSSRFVELQQEVAKRLNLVAGTYSVKYQDEENELILIACDEDLQDCVSTSRYLDNTSIVVFLELKQPITNLNPAK